MTEEIEQFHEIVFRNMSMARGSSSEARFVDLGLDSLQTLVASERIAGEVGRPDLFLQLSRCSSVRQMVDLLVGSADGRLSEGGEISTLIQEVAPDAASELYSDEWREGALRSVANAAAHPRARCLVSKEPVDSGATLGVTMLCPRLVRFARDEVHKCLVVGNTYIKPRARGTAVLSDLCRAILLHARAMECSYVVGFSRDGSPYQAVLGSEVLPEIEFELTGIDPASTRSPIRDAMKELPTCEIGGQFRSAWESVYGNYRDDDDWIHWQRVLSGPDSRMLIWPGVASIALRRRRERWRVVDGVILKADGLKHVVSSLRVAAWPQRLVLSGGPNSPLGAEFIRAGGSTRLAGSVGVAATSTTRVECLDFVWRAAPTFSMPHVERL